MEDQSRPPQAQAQQQPPPPVTGYPAPGYHSAQSNTAYPYYNPNNPNPYNHPNNPTPYPSAPRISFLRRLIFFLIGVFLVFATISFIIWLVLRPRLPEFRVDSVTVSNFTVSSSSSQVTGNWDVKFSVRNPNKKMSIYYDRIDSYLYYKSAFLSETSLAPFYQATKDQTMVSASFASRGNYVNGWVVNDINEDERVGIVGFDVRVLARVRFKNGVWRMRRRLLRVLCPKVKVKLTSPTNGGGSYSGTLLTGNWECRVGD